MSGTGDEVAPTDVRLRRSLWRTRGFTALWTAHTLSQFGTQITFFALPVLAVTTLHSSKTGLGVLTAVETLPFLLIGLPAGVWVDRLPRRAVLITSDLVRAALLAVIPLAHLGGVLTFPLLLVMSMLVGAATVFFDIAYMAYLPALVDRADLPAGNARLEFSRSTAESAGPGLGGLAVQWMSATSAVWGNVFTYLGSALLLGWTGPRPLTADDAPGPARPQGLDRDDGIVDAMRSGMRFAFGQPILRTLVLSTAVANLFGIGGALSAVLPAYALHDLGLPVGLFGLALTLGNAGAAVGALVNGLILRLLGIGRTLALTALLPAFGLLLLATAGRADAVVVISVAIGLVAGSVTIYNINQVSLRQAMTPDRLQGRMNASIRVAIWGTLPFGAVAGGALADLIGVRPALWCLGTLACTASIPLLLSRPVRTLRELPRPHGTDVPGPAAA